MTSKCKYASMCRHYRSADYTCQNEDESREYCGTYYLFATKERGEDNKR